MPLLASAERYDPAADTWKTAGTLTTGRAYHSATLLADGTVLVAGGDDDVSIYLASAERYDPSAGTWTAVPPMSTARSQHTATRLLDGRVLVAGGADPAVLASAELFDPAASLWTAAPSMMLPRYAHTATLLASGQVLAAGGANVAALATARLYTSRGAGSPLRPGRRVRERLLAPTASAATRPAAPAPATHARWPLVLRWTVPARS